MNIKIKKGGTVVKRTVLENPIENQFVYKKENGLTLPNDYAIIKHDYGVSIEGKLFPYFGTQRARTISSLTNMLKKFFDIADYVEITFNSPCDIETYEYNKVDGKWYLVEQSYGWS